MTARLDLDRARILAFRRRAGALDERLPHGPDSLRQAAWSGLQDSVRRAALLAINARVEGAHPSVWEDPSLVQLWGPRYAVFVVAARDRAVFSLGRLPDEPGRRQRAEELAGRLETLLDGATMTYSSAGRALGIQPNSLRYAAATGRVLIRWDGARKPTVRTVPRPEVDRARPASSWHGGTCTWSALPPPRPSRDGPPLPRPRGGRPSRRWVARSPRWPRRSAERGC